MLMHARSSSDAPESFEFNTRWSTKCGMQDSPRRIFHQKSFSAAPHSCWHAWLVLKPVAHPTLYTRLQLPCLTVPSSAKLIYPYPLSRALLPLTDPNYKTFRFPSRQGRSSTLWTVVYQTMRSDHTHCGFHRCCERAWLLVAIPRGSESAIVWDGWNLADVGLLCENLQFCKVLVPSKIAGVSACALRACTGVTKVAAIDCMTSMTLHWSYLQHSCTDQDHPLYEMMPLCKIRSVCTGVYKCWTLLPKLLFKSEHQQAFTCWLMWLC